MWILSKSNEIIRIINFTKYQEETYMYVSELKNKNDFYDKPKIMFCEVETIENETVLYVVVLKSWISNGMLKWPNSYSAATRKRRNFDPPEPHWNIQECKLLKYNI